MPRISKGAREECVRRYTLGESSEALGEEYGLSGSAVRGLVRRRGGKIRSNREARRKSALNHAFFSVIDSEEKAYWLGFLMADGCVTRGAVCLRLATIDTAHVSLFQSSVRSTHKVIIREKSARDTGWVQLAFRSQEMLCDLANFGVVPRKSHVAEPPNLRGDLMRHFWRGVIDGDGSITTKRWYEEIRLVGSKAICNGFADWASAMTSCHVGVCEHRAIWQARISGRHQVSNVLSLLYEDANFSLRRKIDKAFVVLNASQNIRDKAKVMWLEVSKQRQTIAA